MSAPAEQTEASAPSYGDRRQRRLGTARAVRAVKARFAAELTPVERISNRLTIIAGSTPFLLIHVVWFAAWVGWNELAGKRAFDPFPFGLLTMVVSLEAIILSVFVLLSQNRQAAKERIRGDIEYEVNIKAEMEVAHLHEKVDLLNANTADSAARIRHLERLLERGGPRT